MNSLRLWLNRPRNIYLLAFITVIVLTISIQLLTQNSLYLLEQKGKIIELAEHHGLLSQKIAKLALESKEEEQEYIKKELETTRQQWISIYNELNEARNNVSLSEMHENRIDSLMQIISPYQDDITTAMVILIHSSSDQDKLQAIQTIRQQERKLLTINETLTHEWLIITDEAMRYSRLLEFALALASMIILLIELIFIMLPAFRKLLFVNKALKVAYEEQETLNEELCATQEELQQSLDYQIEISDHLKEAKQKAEEASKAKEQFLSTMSHEIRTPMNAVIGITHLLLDDDPKHSQIENLQALKFSGDALLSLINDILDYSKIEAGKIELEETQINLTSLFKGIKQSLGVHANEKQISLNCHLSDNIPKNLLGDPTRLAQVLNNLVSNAIKFTLHGEVNLKATLAERSEKEVKVNFKVQDTGIGIPKDKLESIFQSFTQAEKDTSRKFGGSGLGLTISKKLLEIHNSELKVSSKLNKGSTFTFTLAFKYYTNELKNESFGQIEHIQNLRGARVLVAEDNHVNCIVIKQFLKKWNVNFKIVDNGQLAVDILKKEDFDIILMDLQMPKMDGYTACKEIRKFNTDIPIIALTAAASKEVQEAVLTAGMNDYATKPFVPGELYSKIEQQLRTVSG